MTNPSDPQGQGQDSPQPDKLVLPLYSAPKPDAHQNHNTPSNQHRATAAVRPGQLLRRTGPLPKSPFARLGYLWLKDSAHKVLIVAAGTVLIAGGLFVFLTASSFVKNLTALGASSTSNAQNASGVVPTVPAGTVDLRPSFPAPSGGQGSTDSSQPPLQGQPNFAPTPTVTVTPIGPPSPTPGGGDGTLTVQITNIPNMVQNNSQVSVDVQTSLPNVTVRLNIAYNIFPYYAQSGEQVTDGNGNATLSWFVQVLKLHRNFNVTATVRAVAIDQNGQRVFSAPVTVQVV